MKRYFCVSITTEGSHGGLVMLGGKRQRTYKLQAIYERNRQQMKMGERIKKRAQWIKDNPLTPEMVKAKMQGYEGVACVECGKFTVVRNGTMLKCNTCGACRN